MIRTRTVRDETCDFCKEDVNCYDEKVEIGPKAFSKYSQNSSEFDICPRCKIKLIQWLQGNAPLFIHGESK
jgi:hypothetical protein